MSTVLPSPPERGGSLQIRPGVKPEFAAPLPPLAARSPHSTFQPSRAEGRIGRIMELDTFEGGIIVVKLRRSVDDGGRKKRHAAGGCGGKSSGESIVGVKEAERREGTI